MDRRLRVGLIFGGKSGEHEVSLASAQSVAGALDPAKYETVLIGVTREGRWLIGGDALVQLASRTQSPLLRSEANGEPSPEDSSKEMATRSAGSLATNGSLNSAIDVAFPLIHGPFGEDGTVQGMLELADIPYVGAGVAASAVGMDKALMKSLFKAAGLPTVDYVVVLRREWERQPEETIRKVEATLGYPCFVKPANLGSSVGITKAHDWDQLTQALANSAQYDRKLLVERAVAGREIECSVLGNDDPVASLPGEVRPRREYYDYVAKYDERAGTELIVPAPLTPEQTRAVQEMAIRAFKAIDCCGMARVDFFLQAQDGSLLLNEINTIPGFTRFSMYPKLWEASGLRYPRLVDRLIELALERQADKRRSKVTY